MSLSITMLIFSVSLAISPGPINFTILSSGVNHGVKRTLPYVSGASIGFIALLLFIGLVFDQFIQGYPALLTFIALFGSMFIIYMGYKIATTTSDFDIQLSKIPRFHHGFFIQWVNPISWLGCVSAASLFSNPDTLSPFMTFAGIYFIVCYLSQVAWATLGDKLTVILNSPVRLRAFNLSMGLLLSGIAVMMCYQQLIGVF